MLNPISLRNHCHTRLYLCLRNLKVWQHFPHNKYMGLVFCTQGQVTPKRIVQLLQTSNSSETNPCFCYWQVWWRSEKKKAQIVSKIFPHYKSMEVYVLIAMKTFWPKLVLEIFHFESVENVRRQLTDDGPLLYYIFTIYKLTFWLKWDKKCAWWEWRTLENCPRVMTNHMKFQKQCKNHMTGM